MHTASVISVIVCRTIPHVHLLLTHYKFMTFIAPADGTRVGMWDIPSLYTPASTQYIDTYIIMQLPIIITFIIYGPAILNVPWKPKIITYSLHAFLSRHRLALAMPQHPISNDKKKIKCISGTEWFCAGKNLHRSGKPTESRKFT